MCKSNYHYYNKMRDKTNKRAINRIKKVFGKQSKIEILSHHELNSSVLRHSSLFLVDDWLKITYDHRPAMGWAMWLYIRELKCPNCSEWLKIDAYSDGNSFSDLASFGDKIRKIGSCRFCNKNIAGIEG